MQEGAPIPAVADVSGGAEAARPSIDEAIARWRDALTGEGRAAKTVSIYAKRVAEAAAAAGWRTVDHVDWAGAVAFLAARRRNDHAGKAWGGSTCHQAVSALRSFGEFLRKSRLLAHDPFADLDHPRKGEGRHKHPFTAAEATAHLAAAMRRHNRSRRARGCAPLVWYTMFCTGLRHSEVAQITWGDVVLNGELPGIWTVATWEGNKAKRRDWIPLYPRLAGMLGRYRETVAHRPGDRVFPHVPVRSTWDADRTSAGLPEQDDDGRLYSAHATRASLATWLGSAGVQEGLRQTIMRHGRGLTEGVYTVRSKAELAEAIQRIPDIWPNNATPLHHENLSEMGSISLASGEDRADTVSSTAARPPPPTIERDSPPQPGSSRGGSGTAGPDPGLARPPDGPTGDSDLEPLLAAPTALDPAIIASIETLNLVVRRVLGLVPRKGAPDVRDQSNPTT